MTKSGYNYTRLELKIIWMFQTFLGGFKACNGLLVAMIYEMKYCVTKFYKMSLTNILYQCSFINRNTNPSVNCGEPKTKPVENGGSFFSLRRRKGKN